MSDKPSQVPRRPALPKRLTADDRAQLTKETAERIKKVLLTPGTEKSNPFESVQFSAKPKTKLNTVAQEDAAAGEPADPLDQAARKIAEKTIIDHPRIAPYAFAFDIDGVIIRGPETIPQAPLALRMLNGENKYNIKVPYIFVTNGGGRTEEKRCEDMSKRLGIQLSPDQFIQGHTPMRDLADEYKTVLVVGGVGNACRSVAQGYGFKDVVTPFDILRWNPAVSPYKTLTEEELETTREVDFSVTPIDAILVFADEMNSWAASIQIILELLLSKNGVMGTVSETGDEGPEIFFAHNDFVWATNYSLNRYGMGALQVTISALYKEHTGKNLNVNKFGKPHRNTFKYASKVLTDWRQETYESNFPSAASTPLARSRANSVANSRGTSRSNSRAGSRAGSRHGSVSNSADGSRVASDVEEDAIDAMDAAEEKDEDEEIGNAVEKGLGQQFADALSDTSEDLDLLPKPTTVYFVGDTPESDIRFANTFDESWHSILVKTGVYKDGTKPAYQPKTICDNVLDAVEFAIELEHEKELAEYNSALKAGVVDEDEELHPHHIAEILKSTNITPNESSADLKGDGEATA